MNERIKELLLQNRNSFTNGVTDTNGGVYIHGSQENLEKFAELIVKECMDQIEEVKNIKAGNAEPVYTQGFDDGMFVAIRTIEEHFGVEE